MTTLKAAPRHFVAGGGAARSTGSGALSLALVQNAGGVVVGRDRPYVLDDGGPLVAGNADVCTQLQAVLSGP
jgi:hypothetical protein